MPLMPVEQVLPWDEWIEAVLFRVEVLGPHFSTPQGKARERLTFEMVWRGDRTLVSHVVSRWKHPNSERVRLFQAWFGERFDLHLLEDTSRLIGERARLQLRVNIDSDGITSWRVLAVAPGPPR